MTLPLLDKLKKFFFKKKIQPTNLITSNTVIVNAIQKRDTNYIFRQK
jgi:hypothetical protein